MKTLVTKELVDAASLGGAVLGGGGGGSRETGRRLGYLAAELGRTWLVDATDLSDDTWVLMVSAVGAPAAKGRHAEPMYYVRAAQLIEQATGISTGGIITNEAGGLATVNGWLQAALMGLPVVDAPGNGRAHPASIMGAMGLERDKGYESVQAAIGGDREAGTYVELVVKGDLSRCSNMVRQAAVQAGGLVAVARNPVTIGYAKKNAAVGAVRQAIALGQAMLQAAARGPQDVLEAAAGTLGGTIFAAGRVTRVDLTTTGGFDVGKVTIEADDTVTLDFWNEYMTLEKGEVRHGTFPDLIATMDARTGYPLTSAEIAAGQEVAVLHVPRERLLLGASMHNQALLATVEQAIGKEIVKYLA
ncbi:MAG: uncharacterized protein PWR31_1146 [Bacillota bacterium]|nr:uncharacterized protein [Bacillota bacterium]